MSVPCRPGTPAYKLQAKTRSRACTHVLPRALRHLTLPPSQGALRGCHVSSGPRSHLPDIKGSTAASCTVALDPASLQGRVPEHHMSYSSRSFLTAREGSGSLCVLQLWILPPSKEGPRAPHVLYLQIPPPCRGGL
jgi:hypothetical protein